MLGTDATEEKIEMLSESMGLNDPWYVRYFSLLGGLLRFDLGESWLYGESVSRLILQRLPVTFSLTVFSLLIAVVFSSVLGILAALKKGSLIDGFARSFVQLASAVPSFWLGMVAIIIFAGNLGWFPVNGYVAPGQGFGAFLNSITLPSIILAIGESGLMTRMVRSSMLKALDQDFMLSARVKGLSRTRSVVTYALRSAVIAPITLVGTQAAKLFGGTVIIETIFALPGIGRLLLVAVEQRDIVLLQGIVLFITGMVVMMNLLTDIFVHKANPLIRLDEEEK